MKRLLLLFLLAAPLFGQSAGYPESNLAPAYLADTGAQNALTVQLAACPQSLAATQGLLIKVLPGHNTTVTAPTLNVCGFGAKTITKNGSGLMSVNDISTTQMALFVYDGTGYELLDPREVFTSVFVPAANCVNAVAGSGWSAGSGGTVTCRAGTNNLGAYAAITDTSTTFATFQIPVPEDWDSSLNPWIRFQIASTDAVNAHTIIPEINVACYKGDGTTTDDVAANGFHSLSTITLNGNANRFWSTSNVQMNGSDVTGCIAGALMQITVGRATDTATNAEFYGATITFARVPIGQAN